MPSKLLYKNHFFLDGRRNINFVEHVLILQKDLFKRATLLKLFLYWLRNCVLPENCLPLRFVVFHLTFGRVRTLMRAT